MNDDFVYFFDSNLYRYHKDDDCVVCDDCGWVYRPNDFGDYETGACGVCGGDDMRLVPLEDAGYVFDDLDECTHHEDFVYELQSYVNVLKKQGFDMLTAYGENLDWRGRSGVARIDIDDEEILKLFTAYGNFELTVKWCHDNALECVVYHHDCPLGSRIRIVPTNSETKNFLGYVVINN